MKPISLLSYAGLGIVSAYFMSCATNQIPKRDIHPAFLNTQQSEPSIDTLAAPTCVKEFVSYERVTFNALEELSDTLFVPLREKGVFLSYCREEQEDPQTVINALKDNLDLLEQNMIPGKHRDTLTLDANIFRTMYRTGFDILVQNYKPFVDEKREPFYTNTDTYPDFPLLRKPF